MGSGQVIIVNKEKEIKESITELLRRLESGLVPDEELRQIFRTQLERRLRWGYKSTFEEQQIFHLNFIKSLKQDEVIGREKGAAKDVVLYDIPITYLNIVFGNTLKESACYFREEATTLDEATKAALELYCERAQIKDGQRILDIGCGHGSFMFYVTQRYQNCHVIGITNSKGQKDAIEEKCRDLKLSNVEVIFADVTKFETDSKFDRIVSIESLEHIKNCGALLKKVSTWMKDDGLLFVDILCHKAFGHHFEKLDEEDDLYSAYLFPRGIAIQAVSTLLYFQDDISIVDHWILKGTHMARTMEELLKNLDGNIDGARQALRESGFSKSEEDVSKFVTYWRTFLIAWIEQFNYNNGYEWMISQSLFKKK